MIKHLDLQESTVDDYSGDIKVKLEITGVLDFKEIALSVMSLTFQDKRLGSNSGMGN